MRPNRKTQLAALALSLAVAPAARAGGVLNTPPVHAYALDYDGLDGKLYCQIRNVGPTPMQVTMEGMAYDGTAISSESHTLAPNQGESHLVDADGGIACRFTVSGNKKYARAIALYWSPSDGTYRLALPAR
jgi:hypothetical protein